MESGLTAYLTEILEQEPEEPLWALALNYEAEAPIPPTISTCTLRERETWSPGGSGDWWLTNPAEWDDDGLAFPLPDDLDELCRAVASALEAKGQAAKGVKLLHRVARGLNTGAVLVYAREVEGDREEDDLRRSLPPDRFAQLRAAGVV